MSAKTLSILFGTAFLAVGLLGFIDNPIVGDSPDAIFHADTLHNGVHIGSGVLFLLIGITASRGASMFMVLFGTVYLLLGILGLMDMGSGGTGKVLGILHVNSADNFLHIGLGILIIIGGVATRAKPSTA